MAKIYLTPNTQSLYKKIKEEKFKSKIKAGLAKLSQNPYLGKKLKGELEGQYSVKIWPHRIIYYITQNKDIIVTDIRHRRDVYR